MDYNELIQSPAKAYVLEQSAFQMLAGKQISVAGGMGLPSGVLNLPQNNADLRNIILQMKLARQNTPRSWRGLDFGHCHKIAGVEFTALDVMAAMESGIPYLDQVGLDFITNKPASNHLDVYYTYRNQTVVDYFEFDLDEAQLMTAFKKQMVADAEPVRHQVKIGMYRLKREPLKRLDSLIIYDVLHLYIVPQGIFCGIIHQDKVVPFFWTPDGINTSQVWVEPITVFAIDALMACIWRDACVVERHFVNQVDKRKPYVNKDKPKHDSNTVRLPSKIFISEWGQKDERQTISSTTREAHAVRGCYVRLQDDHKASDDARYNADYYGFPYPPDGYTFRKPHTRGQGEVKVKQVVCRGLQVAKTVLN